MKKQTSLLYHKEQFTSLYDIVPEGDNRMYIKSIIDGIEQQLTNKPLSDGYIKLYFDFYDRLLTVMEKVAN